MVVCGLTIAFICVAAASQLVVRGMSEWGPAINEGPHPALDEYKGSVGSFLFGPSFFSYRWY